MRRIVVGSLVCVGLVGLAITPASFAMGRRPRILPTILQGRVTDAFSRQPVAGAKVRLFGALGRQRVALPPATTDRAGRYVLTTSLSGLMFLSAAAVGYDPQTAWRWLPRAAGPITVDFPLAPQRPPSGPAGTGGGIIRASWKRQATSQQTLTLSLRAGWNQIAVPLLLRDARPSAFLDPLIRQNVTNGILYYWNGTTYVIAQQVEPGRSYWVLCARAATITLAGDPVAEITLSLAAGSAMVGNPFLAALPLQSVDVIRGSQIKRFQEAIQAGALWPGYVRWDGAQYQFHRTDQGAVPDLPVGQGVWIKVNEALSLRFGDATPPAITSVLPQPSPALHSGDPLTISATVSDDDPSPLEYQFSIDGTVRQVWSAAATYRWDPTAATIGPHTVTVEVRDAGGSATKNRTLYLYRAPPELP